MISPEELAKIDNFVMREIKVKELNRIIAKTDKGNLTMKIEKDESVYKFFLDSIPLNKKICANLTVLFDGILYDIPYEEADFVPEEKPILEQAQSGIAGTSEAIQQPIITNGESKIN